VQLNHHRVGTGEPLLLIHGVGSQWQVWRPLLDLLAPHRDVIAVDLPGFGESPPLPDAIEPTPYALTDALVEFLDQLGLERPAVAGNSLGGLLALELARRDRVRSVAALSPAGFGLPRERAWANGRLGIEGKGAHVIDKRFPRLVRNPVARTVLFGGMTAYPWRISPDEAVDALSNLGNSPGFEAALKALGQFTFAGGDDIRVPVTIVWPNRDLLLIPRQADRAVRVIPGARLVRLPRAGHVPTWDAPDEIARILLGA
jgi:pimeloyl-ACP methyl ester carboxylesterase